jgi:hypothetical protein
MDNPEAQRFRTEEKSKIAGRSACATCRWRICEAGGVG